MDIITLFKTASERADRTVTVGQGMAHMDAIRQVRITEQTYYRWRKQYGGMGADQLKELKRLRRRTRG